MKQLSQATTWNNGCGLASISTVLMDKLGSSEWRQFSQKLAFRQLLRSFSDIYQVPRLNWKKIEDTIKAHLHPEDRQILWIPPLRAYLKKVLLKETDYRSSLFPTFQAALNLYLCEGVNPTDNEYVNIYRGNKELFETLRKKILKIPSQYRAGKIEELLSNDLLISVWEEVAYPAYCNYISQIDEGVMLTAEELSVLCKSLQISLTIHASSPSQQEGVIPLDGGAKGYQGTMPLGCLEVFYNGNHWAPYLEEHTQAHKDLLWQHGVAELSSKNFSELNTIVSAQLQAPASSPLTTSFRTLVINRQYNDLAHYLCTEPYFITQQGAREVIDGVLERQDIPLLLTIYMLSKQGRNYILDRLFLTQNKSLQGKLLNYVKRMETIDKDSSRWVDLLHSSLQPIDHCAGDSALHLAIRQNNTSLAINLIRQNADLYATNDQQETPLHLIFGLERAEILKGLLSYSWEVQAQLAWYQKPSHFIDLTVQNSQGYTPLHYAALVASPKNLMLIFDKTQPLPNIKYDVNKPSHHKQTPLHLAAMNSFEEIVKLFISLGGSVVAEDENGYTPLHYAAIYNRLNHVQLLKAVSIKPYSKLLKLHATRQSSTPFAIALANLNFDILVALLTNNIASLQLLRETKNAAGLTAVHLAAARGEITFIKKLSEWFWNHNLAQIYDNNGRTLVHAAAEQGQLAVVKLLREKKMSFSSTDNDGNQPLHLAAANGHAEVVQFLLDEYHHAWSAVYEKPGEHWLPRMARISLEQSMGLGAFIDLNPKNKTKQTPYRLAARNGHWDVAGKLREYIGDDKFFLAIQKIKENDVDGLIQCIKKEPSIVSEVDENDFVLLHHVMIEMNSNTLRMCEVLQQAGAALNVGDGKGKTALHYLAANWDWERKAELGEAILTFLITKGVRADITEKQGFTPLHLAAINGKERAISLLLRHGAGVDYVSSDGLSALHLAVWAGRLSTFKVLLNHHANLNLVAYPSAITLLYREAARSNMEITALWLALQQGKSDILNEIIGRKLAAREHADLVKVKNGQGQGLLHFFAAQNDRASLEPLADIIALTEQDPAGWAPLHVAASLGHLAVVSFIVEKASKKPAILEQATQDDKTPFLIARENDQNEVMQYLASQGATELSEPVARKFVSKVVKGAQKQRQLATELEQTMTYQWLTNFWYLSAPLVVNFYAGPHAMALKLLHQYLTYASPSLILKMGGKAYYSIKPYAHNYAPWWVESGLDSVATVSSQGIQWTFEGMRRLDWIQHPLRRGTGSLASHLLLNLASWFTANKELLAGAYFFGREAGMAVVDAYQYQPSEGTQELSQAYTIWGAILGKERGESFAKTLHDLVLFRNAFYGVISPSSNFLFGRITNFSEYLGSQVSSFGDYLLALDEAGELFSPCQGMVSSAAELWQRTMKLQREISHKRDLLLQDLEKLSVETLVPDGQYRAYAIKFIEGIKFALYGNKLKAVMDERDKAKEVKEEAEKKYNQAKQFEQTVLENSAATDDEKKMAHAKKVDAEFKCLQASSHLNDAQAAYDALEQQFSEQADRFKEAYDNTPTGAKLKSLQNAQEQQIKARIAFENKKIALEYQEGSQSDEKHAATQNELDALEKDLSLKNVEVDRLKKEYGEVCNSIELVELNRFEEKRISEFEEKINKWKVTIKEQNGKYTAFKNTSLEEDEAKNEVDKTAKAFEQDKLEYDDADRKIKLIDQPRNFSFESIVEDAFHKGGNVKENLMKVFVEMGVISYQEIEQVMKPSLDKMFEGGKARQRMEEIEALMVRTWYYILEGDYKKNCLKIRKEQKLKMDASLARKQEAEEKYKKAQEATEATKNEYISLLTPEQATLFIQGIEFAKHTNQLRVEITQSDIALEYYKAQYISAQQKVEQNQLKIQRIDNPIPIDVTQLVNAAFAYSKDPVQIVDYLIKGIVATGIISLGEAQERMQRSFLAALDTRHEDKKYTQLINSAQEHVQALHGDYRQNFVALGVRLERELEDAKSKYCNEEKRNKDLKDQEKVAVENHVKLLPSEEQESFRLAYAERKVDNEKLFWEIAHPIEVRSHIISLVGQPKYVIDYLASQALAMIPAHRQEYYCNQAAEILIHYKYQFLTEPSVEIKLKETRELSNELKKHPFNEAAFSDVKKNIDIEIAKNLLQSAVDRENVLSTKTPQDRAKSIIDNVNNDLLSVLSVNKSNVLSTIKVSDGVLEEKLFPLIESEDYSKASDMIAVALQENTESLSKQLIPKWNAPPAPPSLPDPAPNVAPPKKKSKAKRLWDETIKPTAGEVGQAIVDGFNGNNGDAPFTIGVNHQGRLTGRIADQEPITLYNFQKDEPKPLFEISGREGPVKADTLKQAEAIPSSVKYAPLDPTKLAESSVIVVDKNKSGSVAGIPFVKTNPTVLSTSAYLPSLNPMAGQPLIFRQPNIELPTPAIVFADIVGNKAHQDEKPSSRKPEPKKRHTEPVRTSLGASTTGGGATQRQGIPLRSAATNTSGQKPFSENWLMSWVPEGSGSGLSQPFYEVAINPPKSSASSTESLGTKGRAASLVSKDDNKKQRALISELKRILNPFPAAEAAVPIAIVAAQSAMGAAAVNGVIHSRMGVEEQAVDSYGFPITDEDRLFYGGQNPSKKPIDIKGFTFPALPLLQSKTETLVDQPGDDQNVFTFPKTVLYSALSSLYFRKGDKDHLVERQDPLVGPRKTYQHDYPKHQPKAGGFGAKWAGASVNPIPNAEVGQMLLDTSYYDSTRKGQLFNYHEGKVIKFRDSNDGRWHAYEVDRDIQKNVGNDVLKKFLDDGLISKSEYKKLIRQ